MSHPKMCLCDTQVVLAKGKVVLVEGSRETSASPLIYLEELELGALPIIRDYQS